MPKVNLTKNEISFLLQMSYWGIYHNFTSHPAKKKIMDSRLKMITKRLDKKKKVKKEESGK